MSDYEKNGIPDAVANMSAIVAESGSETSSVTTSITTTTSGHKDGTKAIAEGGNGTGIAEGGNGKGGTAEGGNGKGTAEGGNGRTKSQHQRSNGSGALPKFRTFSGSNSRPFSGRKTNGDYLTRLTVEKNELEKLPAASSFKHVVRLVNNEIKKVRGELHSIAEESGTKNGDEEKPTNDGEQREAKKICKKIFLQEKVFIPVNEYPNYNFVGRILGPRGMTAKQMEEDTGCRIMIRGRGSTREDSTHRPNMNSDSMKEDLHVLVQCEDYEEAAKKKVKRAVEYIRYLLVPPPEGEDELKRKQLMELSIINGTYRPTNASRTAFHNRTLYSPLNPGNVGVESPIHGMNTASGYTYGGIEGDRHVPFYDPRAGLNLYGTTQHYPYNAYAMNTRQALSTLGFDMDAFELADCYGRRINKTPPNILGGQAAAAAAAAAAAQYSNPFGITPAVDPFGMQYVWNNPSMINTFENPPNSLAKEYCNQVVAGFTAPMGGNMGAMGDGMAQSPNVPPVNLDQYMTAAALLRGAPTFQSDGSGDGPHNRH